MSTTIVQEPNFSFFHYEELETEFHKGDILHNMSGSDYKVIECYTNDCLLLQHTETDVFVVGKDVKKYIRWPVYEDGTPGKKEEGIEWKSGDYLSNDFRDINFEELRKKYGKN